MTTKTVAARLAAAVQTTADTVAALAATEADLAALASVDAAQLLTDPGKAAQVAEGRARLARLAEVQTDMVAAAQQAEGAAARAVIALEAEATGVAIASAEAELETWETRERDLLDQLEGHTGVRYERPRPTAEDAVLLGGRVSVKAPSNWQVKARIELLKAQEAGLLAASRGDDPAAVCPVDKLPDSLKAGGILPSPSAVARAAEDAQRAAVEAEAADCWAGDASRLHDACQLLGIDAATVGLLDYWERPDAATLTGWRQQAERAAALSTALVPLDALTVVAELAGTGVADSMLR